jgi:Mg-chelatase subunit ChlD
MSSWSARRKIGYTGAVLGFLLLFVVAPLLYFTNDAPTCFDGSENGDERGVDCGGSCQLLCSFEAKQPNILWSRALKVAAGMYSATAYIENNNITSAAYDVPYIFKFYNAQNKQIGSRQGVAYIPKNQIFAVFEPNIRFENEVPTRTVFEFLEDPRWLVTAATPQVTVQTKRLARESETPRVEALLENESPFPYENIEVVAIVYDGKDNAVGTSRTYVDKLAAGASQQVVFTWPEPFEVQDLVCRVPADVAVVIDRSGSMASDGSNPPQPLTDVKAAAVQFVSQLGDDDTASVISYANEASSPLDQTLTADKLLATAAIEKISILKNGLQQTNITDGLSKAFDELVSERARSDARKVIIALTDGDPTRPLLGSDPQYPQNSARAAAQSAKEEGVLLYTVGLGSEVNNEFLMQLASSPEYYFPAVTTESLNSVYQQIADSICKDTPTSIEIIPLVAQ